MKALFARFMTKATGMPVSMDDPAVPMESDMDDPYRDYVRDSLVASPRVDRQSASVVTIESNKLVPLILALLAVAFAIAVYASEKAERALDEARHMERENRIMQDDLKYVRAYLSARGINIPANHEEAEERK